MRNLKLPVGGLPGWRGIIASAFFLAFGWEQRQLDPRWMAQESLRKTLLQIWTRWNAAV